MTPDDQLRHWERFASGWEHIGPPLRPSELDLTIVRDAVFAETQRVGRPLRLLLLGVTPEIAGMGWPPGTELLAVERSPEMIRTVWPGDTPYRRAVCGDWLNQFEIGSTFDVIVGDGSVNAVASLHELSRLTARIHASLAPDGLFITRVFLEPEPRESPNDVFRALSEGRTTNFHAFKFRLAMSLQPAPGSGVRLGDVWNRWHEERLDELELHAATGWPLDTIRTIHLYRDSPGRLCFPTPSQTDRLWKGHFTVESASRPNYEMGDRCPTFVLRKRG